MKEFVPERETKTEVIEPDQSVEIEFWPKNRGWLVAVAEAPWKDVEPVKRKLELIPPDNKQDSIEKIDKGLGVATLITHHVREKDFGNRSKPWKCRVTNLCEASAAFTVRLLYPGEREIMELTITKSLLEDFVNKLLGETSIRITQGEEASHVQLPKALGIDDITFTVPDFRKKIMFVSIHQYPSNIDSERLVLSLINADKRYPNGGLGMTIMFAGDHDQIMGTFHGRLTDMRLVIQLGLAMDDGAVTYNRVEVSFDFDLDVKGIPDWLFDPVFHYTDSLKQAVEENLKALLDKPETREAFSNGLTEQIQGVIPEGSQLHSLTVSDNDVVLKHFER